MAEEQPSEEQPSGAESSSEEGTAAAEGTAAEEGTAAAENQPPRAAASSAETPGAMAGDDSAGHEGTEGADSTRRTLCRSSTDKVIAGVAGGIGAYFGIDAVIVRIAFIVLTFLGGAGPFLYLIGWLGLPREDSPSVVANALRGDSPHRLRSLAAVILIVLGLLITASLSGELFDVFVHVWSIAPYLALILIAAGVALVLWPGPAGRPKPSPARPPAPAAPPPSSAYATPAPPPPTAAGSEWSVAASPPPTAAGSEWSVAAPPPPTAAGSEWSVAAPPPPTAAGSEWSVASPPGPPPPAAGSASSAKRRRGRSPFGSLTVAALFVYAGAAVMLDRLDAVDMDIGVFFAIALAITGVGLLASAFAVPARGLIFLGVLLCAPSLLLANADVRWGTGIGEVRVSVTDTGELADEYRHGVGQMVVDLRHLDPDRTDHSVELSLGVGEMLVYVPDNISTTADISVGAGNIRVRYGGPAQGRLADLNDSRDLLEGLWVLPYSDAGDLDDYLDAYERHYHLRILPEQRQSLARLFAEEPGVGGANRARDTLARLLDEARGAGYPWEESDDGIGISRTIVLPVWGEPEGELHLDLDVGVGEAEVITVPAPTQRSTSR